METKPGKTSTEFFALVAAGAVVVASGLDAIMIDPDLLVTYMALSGAYIAQRGYVKGSAAKGGPAT